MQSKPAQYYADRHGGSAGWGLVVGPPVPLREALALPLGCCLQHCDDGMLRRSPLGSAAVVSPISLP